MEKRKDEDPDNAPDATATAQAALADAAGDNPAVATPADTEQGEGTPADRATEDGEVPEGGDTTPTDNPEPPAEPEPDDTGDPDDTGSDSGADGEQDPGGEQKPAQDTDEIPREGSKFGERFLNSGTAAGDGDKVKRCESLAASLIRAALALLTGEMPSDSFIPLMDGALAREAILKARTEGEIAGRNAVIEERLATPPAGAPDLNGTPVARSRRQAASIFDLADMAR